MDGAAKIEYEEAFTTAAVIVFGSHSTGSHYHRFQEYLYHPSEERISSTGWDNICVGVSERPENRVL